MSLVFRILNICLQNNYSKHIGGVAMNTNELIVKYRNKKNLMQIDVASKAGINLQYYQAIERGERKQRLKTLLKIASALDIPLDFLFQDTCKEFLIFSIIDCLERYSEQELLELYNIIGEYLNEK